MTEHLNPYDALGEAVAYLSRTPAAAIVNREMIERLLTVRHPVITVKVEIKKGSTTCNSRTT